LLLIAIQMLLSCRPEAEAVEVLEGVDRHSGVHHRNRHRQIRIRIRIRRLAVEEIVVLIAEVVVEGGNLFGLLPLHFNYQFVYGFRSLIYTFLLFEVVQRPSYLDAEVGLANRHKHLI